MQRWILIGVFTLLAACAEPPLPEIIKPTATTKIQRIYVATQRTRDQVGRLFGQDRSQNIHYGWIDIGIPPTHQPGNLELPRGKTDPARHFSLAGFQELAKPSDFRRAIRAGKFGGDTEMVLYVHGYNNTMVEATYRLAQIATDFDASMPVAMFSWPSAGTVQGYIYDRDSVAFSRNDLEQVMRQLSLAPGGKNLILVAHSMGSLLVMETLRQAALRGDKKLLNRISGVFLMSPDIDPDVFRRQVETIGELPQPFFIFTTTEDRALSVSSFLTGRRDRLGRITDPSEVAGLDVTVIDFSGVADGRNLDHLVPVTSSGGIRFLRSFLRQVAGGFSEFGNFLKVQDPAQQARPNRG